MPGCVLSCVGVPPAVAVEDEHAPVQGLDAAAAACACVSAHAAAVCCCHVLDQAGWTGERLYPCHYHASHAERPVPED